MKKTAWIALILIFAMALCACGGNDAPGAGGSSTPTATVSGTNPSDTPLGYSFTYNNVTFGVGMDAAPVLEALGETKSRVVSASCAFGGNDIVYDYQSVKISTNDETGNEMIYCIELVDDQAQTQKNLKIGAAADAVTAAYGDATKTNAGGLIYEKDGMELRFLLKNGKVSSIQYLLSIAA